MSQWQWHAEPELSAELSTCVLQKSKASESDYCPQIYDMYTKGLSTAKGEFSSLNRYALEDVHFATSVVQQIYP